MNTPEPDYLARRLDARSDWHSKKARFNKQWYLALEITTMRRLHSDRKRAPGK